jgi:hypothetical protein
MDNLMKMTRQKMGHISIAKSETLGKGKGTRRTNQKKVSSHRGFRPNHFWPRTIWVMDEMMALILLKELQTLAAYHTSCDDYNYDNPFSIYANVSNRLCDHYFSTQSSIMDLLIASQRYLQVTHQRGI